MTRVLYIRTSTGKQDGAAQRATLEREAARRQWPAPRTSDATAVKLEQMHLLTPPPVLLLEDVGVSGKRAQRPGLDRIRELARGRELEAVLVTALDRLGRSALDVIELVDELVKTGVIVESLREGTLDPKTPMGRFGIQLFAAFAEMEHGLISERVNGGLERARREGTRSGRPIGRAARDVPLDTLVKACQLRAKGKGWRQAAATLHVPRRTLERKVAEAREWLFGPKRATATPAYSKAQLVALREAFEAMDDSVFTRRSPVAQNPVSGDGLPGPHSGLKRPSEAGVAHK